MLKPQKKITKKEIKEDKLVTFYFETRGWVEQNLRTVAVIAAVPIGLILLFLWWNFNQGVKNEKATTKLAQVIPYFDAGQYDLAINGVMQEGAQGLQAIVDEYGSTKAGEVARFYLGNAYLRTGKIDKALEAFKNVAIRDKMLSASAFAGEAACYEAKGDHAAAAASYEKAASKNMVLTQAPENLEKAAANYAAAGQKAKAVELLTTIKKEFPGSPIAREADRYLAEYAS
jgi:TolA-binding protein